MARRSLKLRRNWLQLIRGSIDITSYFNKLKKLWDKLRFMRASCGSSYTCSAKSELQREDEKNKLHQFLMGLNETYIGVRSNLLMMHPPPSLDTTYSILLQDERQRQVSSPSQFSAESASFNAHLTNKVSGSLNPHSTDKFPVLQTSWFPPSFKFTKDRRTAANVEVQSPNVDSEGTYFQAEGSSDQGSLVPGLSKDQYTQLMLLLQSMPQLSESLPQSNLMASANFAGILTPSNSVKNVSYGACMLTKVHDCIWIIDSGATDYMTSNKDLLFDIKTLVIPYLVTLPNGYKVKVTCTGSLHFLSFTLHHVLYVTSFHYNLISVSKLVSQLDCIVLFTKFTCLIHASSLKRPLVIGKLDHGLYKLVHSSASSQFDVLTSASSSACYSSLPSDFIHCKYHAPLASDSVTASYCTYHSGLNKMELLWHHKLGHMPFARMREISDLPLDDFTRDTWTHLMGSKSNAFSLIKAFISMVKTQFNTAIQIIRSDNAFELGSSNSSREFFVKTGIIDQTYCSHTPQQNGIVERKYSSTSACLHTLSDTAEFEPHSYQQASSIPAWKKAMRKEFEAPQANHTWCVIELHVGKKPIGCKWVYKIKYKAGGTVEIYKARLVVRGDAQVEGVDFNETFSHIVKFSTVKCLITMAVKRSWPIFQLDVNNAFLHGDLDEEVYMKIPPGLCATSSSESSSHLVCHLQNSLYGLRQASRQWYAKLSHALCSRGYTHSLNDYSLFSKYSGSSIILLAVYVDDIILTGIEVAYVPSGLLLHQKKFIRDLLKEYHCEDASSVTCRLDLNHKLKADMGELLPSPEQYRSWVGKLNFLTHTRPDLSFTVQHLSQFLQSLYVSHMHAALHILRYLKGSSDVRVFISSSTDLSLSAYYDSDWAACSDTRRSFTGFCILLGDSLVGWKAKKQPVMSLSSAEVEYKAISKVVAELVWVVRLLSDFGISVPADVPVFYDNQAAIHIAKNHVFHEQTKHIEVDCHFIITKLGEGLIDLHHVPTSSQLVDVFTKLSL
ncbi:uncharacterized protein LOC142168895 [Nicotiana tabacum]|uniref:Uncharacterized protein LOC142168895 n=1 Tax=Nicotiana tabacum TaxID=4097 RepID=A0AC58SMH3_TOBAC